MSFLDTLIFGYRTILSAGVALTQRNKINFVSGFTVADNPTTGATDVTGAAGTTPSGTGLRKVVAGVEDAAASLLVNADVDAAAAIAASKVVQPTGTGLQTVTAGVQDAASASMGAGFLTWVATPSSANLATLVTDETGSGALCFATAPLFKTTINLNNPGNTFKYVITPAAIAADRILNLPLLAATDTVAVLDFAQTLTNKTISGANNTLTVRLASDVSGTLPVANGGTGITALGTGVATWWATPSSANLAAACTDETGSGALCFATSPSFTTSITLLGGTISTFGLIRVGYVADVSNVIMGTKTSASVDKSIIRSGTDATKFGDTSGTTNVDGLTVNIYNQGNQQVAFDGTNMLMSKPIIGNATPYSVHGTVVSAMTDADYTVPSGEYKYSEIEIPSGTTLTAGRLFKLPTPATEAASYHIQVSNKNGGLQIVTVTRADGSGDTVALASGQRAFLRVRPGGVTTIAAAI